MHNSTAKRPIKSFTVYIPEARAKMDRHVFVPFLESVVFTNVVQIITTDDDRALHLHLQHYSG